MKRHWYPGTRFEKWLGRDIKRDNGSDMRLSDAFPGRRFHDNVVYVIAYNGVQVDETTVISIERKRNQNTA